MSLLQRLNTKAKNEINSGFGTNASDYGGRFFNKNGQPNVEKRGINILERTSAFHTLLTLSRMKFFLLVLTFYVVVNLFFAFIYCSAGVENLIGINAHSGLDKFLEAFFFSTQTFTTVGYGHVSPSGFLISSIAAVEALVGLLSLALATGLFYARFSKPKAHIKFSTHAVISPYKDITGLMLRIAPSKNIILNDVEAKLNVGMAIEENGKMANKFYFLPLEYDRVNSLTLGWTIVHPINEESPFYNFDKESFENTRGEILVYIKAFDNMYSNTVVAQSSYTFNEIIYGAKFVPMYHRNKEANKTILELDKLSEVVKVDNS